MRKYVHITSFIALYFTTKAVGVHIKEYIHYLLCDVFTNAIKHYIEVIFCFQNKESCELLYKMLNIKIKLEEMRNSTSLEHYKSLHYKYINEKDPNKLK